MSAAHLTPSTTKEEKKKKFKQTNTLYNTQCSSGSCGVVLTAGRCFWQVNGSSRSTGAGVHSRKESQKQGLFISRYSCRACVLSFLICIFWKFTVSCFWSGFNVPKAKQKPPNTITALLPTLTRGDLWGQTEPITLQDDHVPSFPPVSFW